MDDPAVSKLPDWLEKEFHYYLENQDRFVALYNGKVIVLKDRKVIGAFDSILEAVEKTCEDHELGTFLVQRCTPGEEAYTITLAH